MNDRRTIADDEAWAAVLRRDRTLDGRFVTGVLTTGIYCRPSCAARHPKRENVRFFATGAEAAATGLRPCLRCKPDEVTREARAMEAALKLLAEAEEAPSLDELAAAGQGDATIRTLLDRPEIAEIHAHTQALGCFLARIERN